MRISPFLVFALSALGCKKEGRPENAKPAHPRSDKTTPPAAAKSEGAPKITPDMLFATEPVWTVEALPRGLWFRQGSGPVEHKCRVAFATTWAENIQVRTAAKA